MKDKKRWPLSKIGLFIICLFIASSIYNASGQTNQERISGYHQFDNITINNSGYKKDRKGPVNFPHRKHALEYEVSCWDCHHEYRDKENEWSPWGETQKCIECHDPLKKIGDTEKLQTAYHLSCKNCHRERKIFKDESSLAYRRCTTCHVTSSK